MNQEKIGNYILLKRKEQNLTQMQLAEKLNISSVAISKWENGKCMPDVSLFKELCSILKISIDELISGQTIDPSKRDEYIIDYLKLDHKKNKSKFMKFSIILLISVLLLFLIVYFFNSFNKTKIYSLSGETENFSYSNGLFVKSNIKFIYEFGNLEILNSDISLSNIISISLNSKENNKYNLIFSNSEFPNNRIFYEQYGYNDLFKNNINLQELYLEIKYLDKDIVKNEYLKIKSNVILENNKLINFKKSKISSDKNVSEITYNTELRSILIKNGFSKYNDIYSLNKIVNNNKLNKNIIFNLLDDSMTYEYNNSNIKYWAIYNVKQDYLNVYAETNNEKFAFSYNVAMEQLFCLNGNCDQGYEIYKDIIKDYKDSLKGGE